MAPAVSCYRMANFVGAVFFLLVLIIVSVLRSQTSVPPILVMHHNGTIVSTCHPHPGHHGNSSSSGGGIHDLAKNVVIHEHGGHHKHHHHHNHKTHHFDVNIHNHTHDGGDANHTHGGSADNSDQTQQNGTELRARGKRNVGSNPEITQPIESDPHTSHFDDWLGVAIFFILLSVAIQIPTIVNLRYQVFRNVSIRGISSERVLMACNVLNLLSVILVLIGLGLVDMDHWPRGPCNQNSVAANTRRMNAATLGITWALTVEYIIFCLGVPFLKIYIFQLFDFAPLR